MWNDERGFGFLSPADGGDDVFVHRSALNEGVVLSAGDSVKYEGIWDDKKRKYRAAGVELSEGGGSSSGDGDSSSGHGGQSSQSSQSSGSSGSAVTTSSSSGSSGSAVATSSPGGLQIRAHHLAGSFGNWAIHREAMDGSAGILRHRVIVRADAPEAPSDRKLRREEFQICGDNSWDKRFYPAGSDKEEVVILKPGESGSKAAIQKGKGHGRNWAVDGRPGTAFDILFDPESRTVTCELAFSER